MKTASALLALLALPLGGCLDGVSEQAATRVMDSADVEVITSSDLGFDRGPDAVLERPIFRVGWDDPGALFERLSAGQILQDGTFMVADEAAATLYRIAADGALLDSLGGHGEGLGEFGSLDGIARLPGDSILVADLSLRRTSIFSPAGEFVRSVPMPDSRTGYGPWGSTSNGTVIWRTQSWSPGQTAGWVRFPVMGSTGAHDRRDTLGIFPFFENVSDGTLVRQRPLPILGLTAASDSGFVRAMMDRARLSWFDLNGTEYRRLSWDTERRPTTDRLYDAWVDSVMSGVRGRVSEASLAGFEQDFEESRDLAPDFLPILTEIFPAADGSIWMLGVTGRPMPPNPDFLVIGDSGSCLVRVQGRNSFQFFDANEDHVLGVESNEFGVHGLVLYSAPGCPAA